MFDVILGLSKSIVSRQNNIPRAPEGSAEFERLRAGFGRVPFDTSTPPAASPNQIHILAFQLDYWANMR